MRAAEYNSAGGVFETDIPDESGLVVTGSNQSVAARCKGHCNVITAMAEETPTNLARRDFIKS